MLVQLDQINNSLAMDNLPPTLISLVSSQAKAEEMNDSLLGLLPGVLAALQGQSNLSCSAVTSSGSISVSHSASMTPSSLVTSASSLSPFGGHSFSAGIYLVVPSFVSTFSTLANPACSFQSILPSNVGNSPIASAFSAYLLFSSPLLSVSGRVIVIGPGYSPAYTLQAGIKERFWPFCGSCESPARQLKGEQK